MNLLIIDVDPALPWRVQKYFGEGASIKAARTGNEGCRLAGGGQYDVIVIDPALPDMVGDEVCIALRRTGITTPILAIASDKIVAHKVALLDAGADDYLTKPFDYTELRARLRALTRRNHAEHSQLLEVGDLRVDPRRRQVYRRNTPITLRRKEFDILEYLMRNRGTIVTPAMILEHVWQEANAAVWTTTVRVHIKHLRDKIDKPFQSSFIKTARGVGYIIDDANNPS